MPSAPVADVIPEGAGDAVDYLLERFGVVLDREAAFRAKSLVAAKVQARLEKTAAKEPELAHLLGEVADAVLRSFGRLMASPEAARHAYDALFYLFEGYSTKDGERLYARIEGAIREAVKRAGEAGVADAEYRVRQFVLWLVEVLAAAGERYRRDGLKAVATVEQALRMTTFAGFSAASLYSLYSGLYSEAVVSAVASAIALAEAGRFREAVEAVRSVAETVYREARELFEKVKVALERLIQLFVEAVARVLAWADVHKAWLFLTAAVAAGVVALSWALDVYGLIELGRLAYGVALGVGVASPNAGGYKAVVEKNGGLLERLLEAEEPYKELMRMGWSSLPAPLRNLREVLESGSARDSSEREKDALVLAAVALVKWLGKYGRLFEEAADKYKAIAKLAETGRIPYEEVEAASKSKQELLKALEELRLELSRLANERKLEELYVDEEEAERLAQAVVKEFTSFSDASIGTKAYAIALSMAFDTTYGRAAVRLLSADMPAEVLASAPNTVYNKALRMGGALAKGLQLSEAEQQVRYIVAFVASLRPEERERLKGAMFIRGVEKRKDKEVVVWKAVRKEAENVLIEPLITLEFRRVRGHWTVKAYGPLMERIKARLVEEFRKEAEKARESLQSVSNDTKIASLLGWLASDLSIHDAGEGRKLRVAMSTTQPWQLGTLKALLDKRNGETVHVYVTLKGLKPMVNAWWSIDGLNKAIKESGWVKRLAERGFFRVETAQTLYGLAKKQVETIDELITRLDWGRVLNTLVEMKETLTPLIHVESGADDRVLSDMVKKVEKFIKAVGRLEALKDELKKVRDEEERKKLLKQIREVYKKAREYLAPALLLLELDYALERLKTTGKKARREAEEALFRFGLVFSAALAGDGSVSRIQIDLISGKTGPALLWLAVLYKAAEVQAYLMQMTEKARAAKTEHTKTEVKPTFTPKLVQKSSNAYFVEVSGEGMAYLAALIPAIGSNPKAEKAMMVFRERALSEKESARKSKRELVREKLIEAQYKNLRKTEKGVVVADVVIKAGGLKARYTLYLGEAIMLRATSTNLEEVEKAVHLLRLAGMETEVRKWYIKQKKKDGWHVKVTTDRLASKDVDKGLRDALASAVEKAAEKGLVEREKAERWIEKLREGVTITEDKPKFAIHITNTGGLNIRYTTSSAQQLVKYAETLKGLGLEVGVHFTVKEPKDGERGTLAITIEGVKKLAELSIYAEGETTRKEAAEWVEHLLARARESGGKEAAERLKELVEEGRARGSYMLTGLRREVEIDSERHVVEIKEAKAWMDGDKLRIAVKAVVDGVEVEREFTFGRNDKKQRVHGRAVLWADVPGGRDADRKRLIVLSIVLFGDRPGVAGSGKTLIYTSRHLEYAEKFKELKGTIEKWLNEK